MDENTKKKISLLRNEINIISKNLKKYDYEKEGKYAEKESLSEELNKLIKVATKIKEDKDLLDKEIRVLKEKRDILNQKVKDVVDTIKQSIEVKKKEKINVRPYSIIKKEIENLEYNLQTEVQSFSKEKAIMTKINLLKNELKEAEKQISFRDISKKRKDSKRIKKEADLLHEKIQKLANESSSLFKELTNKSREIQEIKNKKQSIHTILISLKKKIKTFNLDLETTLKEWSTIAGNLNLEVNSFSKLDESNLINEVLKEKKKFTKEDLLSLQRKINAKEKSNN